jgi:plasmid maintenance system antidote protein VapI
VTEKGNTPYPSMTSGEYVSNSTKVMHTLKRRAVSPNMALRLSSLFGNIPEFWLNAQLACDLWKAQKEHAREIKKIKPLNAA